MITEITETTKQTGWIFYDGVCPVCETLAQIIAPRLKSAGYETLPIQTDWVAPRYHFSSQDLLAEMKVVAPTGAILGGADAVLHLAQFFPLTRPATWLARLPLVRGTFHAAYRFMARHRPCSEGICGTTRARSKGRLLLLLIPPLVGGILFEKAPPVLMWGLALSIWFTLKAATWLEAKRKLGLPRVWKILPFLFWPGTDAETFFAQPDSSGSTRWWPSVAFCISGLALIGITFQTSLPPMIQGLLAFAGLLCVLHFGILDLVCRKFCSTGWNALPLMLQPWKAASLADFWGKRWNTGFSLPARRYVFLPLARKWNSSAAAFTVYALSGLVHDLVISLPAQGGYGLPTVYFLLQWVGVSIQRNAMSRGAKLRNYERSGALRPPTRGGNAPSPPAKGETFGIGSSGFAASWAVRRRPSIVLNRLFTIVWLVLPLPLLFHAPFLERVLLPFIQTILQGTL